MATALATLTPILQGVSTVMGMAGAAKNLFGPKQDVPPVLGNGQATRQAQGMLNPVWDRRVDDANRGLTNNLAARGFYGQAPGAQALVNQTGDLNAQRSSAIAQLAQQLIDSSRGANMAARGANLDQMNSGISGLMSAASGFGAADNQMYTQTGQTARRGGMTWGAGRNESLPAWYDPRTIKFNWPDKGGAANAGA